jgi:glycosyltransferase 2 family protein
MSFSPWKPPDGPKEQSKELNTRKILRILAASLVIILIGFFYGRELLKNRDALRDYRLTLDLASLGAALLLCIMSSLIETYIWQASVNKHLGPNALGFTKSIAVMNGSSLLKYLPGRIWIYSAQMVWLKKYGIAKSKILYANLICIIASLTVSLYLGVIYLLLYTGFMDRWLIALALSALVLLNVAYLAWNPVVLNLLIRLVNRYFHKEISPLVNSVPLLVYVQFLYLVSWLVYGCSGYFLLKGVGLAVPSTSLFAILASMSLSWMIGYLAVLAPGGLGVREATMLVMLNQVVNIQTALLFPILSRILLLVAEVLLGLLALVLGFRTGVFASEISDVRKV